MGPGLIAAMQRRLPAIPWSRPIAVQFACDHRPRYGCRLCILRYGLKSGDRTHLFDTEAEAARHVAAHKQLLGGLTLDIRGRHDAAADEWPVARGLFG